ncbi:MAG: hypothetical protein RBU36_15515 [Thermoanaerobaculia bacterium]|jgi:hypothetical protein|nr:hypothetical protein [Thermoanaerobaculia bacterium]
MTEVPPITSPGATGGPGVAFEFQVDAAYLAYLLVGGTPPLLRGCRLESVHLQSRHLDWRTDDLLLVGRDRSGNVHKAALQAKRQFHFRASDDESVAALASAWADFSDAQRFNPARDTLGFVIQSGSSDFFHGFRVLLDCARASTDETDLDRRLKIERYLPKRALQYRDTAREMLEQATNGPIPADQLFQFLRVLDFVHLDFGSSASAAEASIRTIVQIAADATAGVPATDTWSEIVVAIQAWAGRAQSVTASDVAQEIGWPALPRSAPFERELEALRNTTDVVLGHVKSSIQGVEVRRVEAEAALLDAVTSGGFVIVSGEPGVGKSALAGRVFNSFRKDGLTLAFRPGMLGSERHINQVLLPHGQTAARLLSTGALYPRNVILIESAERFLETADAERDAFRDLLATIGEDPSWGVVITCRSFAVETFRCAFLGETTRAVSVLHLPEFTDRDLAVVSSAIPALSVPLSVPRLRGLLRNPFYLGMAARMTWTAPLPSDARSFRQRVWTQVVRRDEYQGSGMPTHRANAFLEVVRRRARSLEAYVPCDDLDPSAIQELRRDMLVAASPENPDALAPADDVLEDWALQHWIETEFTLAARNPTTFFSKIGTHPAIRRAFRVWLSEWLDVAFGEATGWALGVIRGSGYPKHWIDDTVTASLLSHAGGQFVERIAGEEGCRPSALLHQLLHLTRVACRRLPSATHEPHLVGTHVLLPEGAAWEALLGWLERIPAPDLQASTIPLYLNFLEDWCLGVTPDAPYPVGSDAAGRTAMRLAERAVTLGYTERTDAERRALELALRVPKVVAAELQRMVDAAVAPGARRSDSVVIDLVLGVISGAAAARDLPHLAVTCVEHVFGMTRAIPEEEGAPDRYDDGMHAVDIAFGIPLQGRDRGFPASGLHGPFFHLFAHHPVLALDLIVRVANHTCGAYGTTGSRRLERPARIAIALPDGSVSEQWINGRLWGLYRGTSVGPYPLQSALMALENWLLRRADEKDPGLEGTLLSLLGRANNGALTAVVLSAAQAWPEGTSSVILSLLAHQEILDLDRGRMVSDQGGTARMLEGLGLRTKAEDELYTSERKRSNAREHRKQSLETTVLQLQIAGAHKQVWRLLDSLRAALPPVSERTDEDRWWEFALHKMDLRTFTVTGPAEEGRVMIQPGAPAPEVERMLEVSRPPLERHTERLGLFTWAMTAFEGKTSAGHDPGAWREKLIEAVRFLAEQEAESEELFALSASAPAFVAAVCLRDHWEELSESDRTWCVDVVCRAVEAKADDEFSMGGESEHFHDGAMAAAAVVPGLLQKARGTTAEVMLLRALACGVLHAKQGYVQTTMAGIGRDLLRVDRDLALTCLKAAVTYARTLEEKGRGWAWHDDAGKGRARGEYRGIIERRELWTDPETLSELDYTKWPWWGLVKPFLAVLGQEPTASLSLGFFRRLADLLASSWDVERRASRLQRTDDDARKVGAFEVGIRFEVSRALAAIALDLPPDAAVALSEPIRGAMVVDGREVAAFIEQLVIGQDGRGASATFMALWHAFAEAYARAEDRLKYERKDLLRYLFLNVSWKPGVREWEPLRGHEGDVGALFRRLTGSAELIEAFAGFLRSIGTALVPSALADIAEKLAVGNAEVQLTDRAVLRLEPIVSRLIYGGSIPIRRDDRLRTATLTILDRMIDGGSSSAYRMRDDFLTPLGSRQ